MKKLVALVVVAAIGITILLTAVNTYQLHHQKANIYASMDWAVKESASRVAYENQQNEINKYIRNDTESLLEFMSEQRSVNDKQVKINRELLRRLKKLESHIAELDWKNDSSIGHPTKK